MVEINFSKIEKKWQGKWEKAKTFEVKDSGDARNSVPSKKGAKAPASSGKAKSNGRR